MGTGNLKDGKFNLILSIRHNADSTRILQWKRSFSRASEILYDATDGQLQFGKIFISNNSIGSNEADIWLLNEEGTSYSNVNTLGLPGYHMTLYSDEKNKPFIIIHEFGHYAIGLYDEYVGPSGSAECIDDPSTGACIMEHGYWEGDTIDDNGVLTEGQVNEFCVESNHDPDNDTNQENEHGKSCWETIPTIFSGINVPTGLPNDPTPSGHEEIEWIRLADDPNFSLVLDRSGSMSTQNAISGVRYGADYWVNYLAQTGDSLSIVAYNHNQDLILPFTTLSNTTDLTNTLNAISGITPSGSTNIGGAMNESVNQIISPGDRAATQVMILFTDGLHNTGIAPETIIDDLIENGIRAYTIGFGPNADQVRLQAIAEETGGRFEQIEAESDTVDAQLEIQNYLIEISGEVRDGSGIITMAPGLLPEPIANEKTEAEKIISFTYKTKSISEILGKRPYNFRCSFGGFDHKAFVEEGSQRATFVVSFQEGVKLNFFVTRPNGSIVEPEVDPDATFVHRNGAPYAFYIIKNPSPGFWIMRVTRGQSTGKIAFKVFAFSENPKISVGLRGISSLNKVNKSLTIQAQVYHTVPLTNVVNPVISVISNLLLRKRSFTPHTKVIMQEQSISHDLKGVQLEKVKPKRNGLYEGTLLFDESGSYSVQIKFVNRGDAIEVSSEAERPREGEVYEKMEPAPIFTRLKRFQIHVGSLPKGKDVETKFVGKKVLDILEPSRLRITPLKDLEKANRSISKL